ncbi:MAG: hypothetical protein U1F61_11045 [Opitutaceae bacterium]
MMSFLKGGCFLLGVCLAGSTWVYGADTNVAISKARRYLGPEAVLDQVTSVHFWGTLFTDNDQKIAIEIVFQKPYRQRIVTTGAERMETTALDDYEGWQQIEDLKDKGRWRMKLLSKDQVKRLRANTWENLAFFRGIEAKGGKVENLGDVEVEGKPAHKLSFLHPTGSVFTRYFDAETGRLVLTETEQGGRIREEGEIVAGGLRFPQKIVTITRLDGGRERSATIVFDKVVVNESFPPSFFSIPVTGAPAVR